MGKMEPKVPAWPCKDGQIWLEFLVFCNLFNRRSTGKTSFFFRPFGLWGDPCGGPNQKVVNPFLFVGETLKSREDERIKNRQKSKKKAPEYCASSTEALYLLEEMLTGREVLFPPRTT